MCEIFPEVNKCFAFIPARIALIFIGVLAIMTGALAQCILTKGPVFSFRRVFRVITLFSQLKPDMVMGDPNHILSQTEILVRVGISAMAIFFMILGILLLASNLIDAQQMVLLFVWGVVINVFVGFLLCAAVTIECVFKEESCFLNDMDWFTGAFIIVSLIGYLFMWLYFASVANTYSSGLTY